LELIAVLVNAYNVGYRKRNNEIWTAKFSLPSDDPKNDYCVGFNFAEVLDDGERIGLFRILPSTRVKRMGKLEVSYECEHVLATLLDDIMF